MNLVKKALAEALGTFVLVLCACGTAAWTGGDAVATSLAFGLVICGMAYSVGRISGCHINPAVSLGCLLTKRMTLVEFLVYVGSQIVGGFLGAVALFGIAKMGDVTLVGNACNAALDGSVGGIFGAIAIEALLTCIFVYVILNVTDGKNAGVGKKAGLIIGLTLTLVHLVGIGFTGTSVNPARSLATALGDLIFNGTTDAISCVWVFFVGPLVGGALAALIYTLLHKEKAPIAE